jgi:hypothetical protein
MCWDLTLLWSFSNSCKENAKKIEWISYDIYKNLNTDHIKLAYMKHMLEWGDWLMWSRKSQKHKLFNFGIKF